MNSGTDPKPWEEPTWRPPGWPPTWNPFQVFLLILSVFSSVGLIEGNSGSQVLDTRLDAGPVIGWGVCLAVGSILALVGVYSYRKPDGLMLGLYLERTGLILVGGAAAIYAGVILAYASDLNSVRFAASIQIAYTAACFYRAWQDHRAITRTFRILDTSSQISLDEGHPDGR